MVRARYDVLSNMTELKLSENFVYLFKAEKILVLDLHWMNYPNLTTSACRCQSTAHVCERVFQRERDCSINSISHHSRIVEAAYAVPLHTNPCTLVVHKIMILPTPSVGETVT